MSHKTVNFLEINNTLNLIYTSSEIWQNIFNVLPEGSFNTLSAVAIANKALNRLVNQACFKLKFSDKKICYLNLKYCSTLANKSLYFRKIFENNFKENVEKICKLNQFSVDLFKKYVLDPNHQIDNDNLQEALEFANYFGVASLKEKCVEFLKNHIMTSGISAEELLYVFDTFVELNLFSVKEWEELFKMIATSKPSLEATTTIFTISSQHNLSSLFDCEEGLSAQLVKAFADPITHRALIDKITSFPLKRLNLHDPHGAVFHDPIKDEHLKFIENMLLLEELNLSCSEIDGRGLCYLRKMLYLKSLCLRDCTKLRSGCLSNLYGMTSIQSLDLQFCKTLTASCLSFLEGIPLQYLRIDFRLKPTSLEHLKETSSLKTLIIGDCRGLTNECFANCKNWSLEHLELIGNNKDLTGECLKYLNVKSLQHLKFQGPKVSDSCFTYLQGAPLKFLTVIDSPITGRCFSHLNVKNLEELVLDFCSQLEEENFVYLKDAPLKILSLSQCPIIGKGLAYLNVKQLEKINLGKCKQLLDISFTYLKNAPLKSVVIEQCKQLTDDSFLHLKRKPLKKLVATDCERITDTGVAHLSEGMPLRELLLGNCSLCTGRALESLARMPLEILNINSWSQLKDKDLLLLQKLPLRYVDITNCTQISNAGWKHFCEIMPHVKIFADDRNSDSG